MSNDQFKDDEYQYPDNAGETYEAVTSEAGSPTGFNSPMDMLRPLLENRRLMISMGIGFVVFILLQVLVVMKSKKTEQPVATPAPVAHVSQPLPKPTAPVLVQPSESMPVHKLSASNPDQDRVVKHLQHQTEAQQTTIGKMQTQMDAVSSRLAELSSQSENLSERMNAINLQLTELVKVEKQRQQKVAAEKERNRPPKVYHLKAAVEGRAWIQPTDGAARTVKVGDRIQDYGVVTDISPQAGTVTTDSGRVIRFAEMVN